MAKPKVDLGSVAGAVTGEVHRTLAKIEEGRFDGYTVGDIQGEMAKSIEVVVTIALDCVDGDGHIMGQVRGAYMGLPATWSKACTKCGHVAVDSDLTVLLPGDLLKTNLILDLEDEPEGETNGEDETTDAGAPARTEDHDHAERPPVVGPILDPVGRDRGSG